MGTSSKKETLDLPGFDPGTSPMLREHSRLSITN